jgi:hypothetical protein
MGAKGRRAVSKPQNRKFDMAVLYSLCSPRAKFIVMCRTNFGGRYDEVRAVRLLRRDDLV